MTDLAASRAEFTRELIERRLLIPSGVPGLFGRGPGLSRLVAGIELVIQESSRVEEAEHVSFPPLIPRELLRRVGYMENFPQLCGSIHSFAGDDRRHLALMQTVKAAGDWTPHLTQTDVVLLPAACYPLYPSLTGTLPEGGVKYDFTGHCFRNEPSDDPARMQYFQVHEKVSAGSPEIVTAWRAAWVERGLALLRGLGLPVRDSVASDPFFGRGGRLMKANQEELELKRELLVPIFSEESPTAVASFNYHQEHFGQVFEIRTPAGAFAHTACVGFGVDRIAVALLKIHGPDSAAWPSSLRERLWP